MYLRVQRVLSKELSAELAVVSIKFFLELSSSYRRIIVLCVKTTQPSVMQRGCCYSQATCTIYETRETELLLMYLVRNV